MSLRPTSVYRKYLHYLSQFGSAAKMKNMALNRIERRRGRISLHSRPYKVTIDPGNVCNLQCPGCHTGISHPEMIRPRMLRYEHFVRIFDQVAPHVFSVALYNWGEPFLNKKLFDMVAYARSKGVGTTLHSNLNHFNEQMAEECIRSGLTHIYMSIDGATQEPYAQYRVGGQMERVLENLALLTEVRRKYQSKFPIITWKFIAFGHNDHEIGAAKALAAQHGADSFELYHGRPVVMDLYDEADKYRRQPEKIQQLPTRCNSLWSSLYVGADGSVLPCSLAFRPAEVFGNLLEQSLDDVWNNSSFRNARSMFSKEFNADEIPMPCRACKYAVRCLGSAAARN